MIPHVRHFGLPASAERERKLPWPTAALLIAAASAALWAAGYGVWLLIRAVT